VTAIVADQRRQRMSVDPDQRPTGIARQPQQDPGTRCVGTRMFDHELFLSGLPCS
jgi:hypothetical protein